MENTLAVALIVGLVLLFMGIRFVVHAAANKVGDAIHNAVVRRQTANTPPQQQRLADRCAASQTYRRRY